MMFHSPVRPVGPGARRPADIASRQGGVPQRPSLVGGSFQRPERDVISGRVQGDQVSSPWDAGNAIGASRCRWRQP